MNPGYTTADKRKKSDFPSAYIQVQNLTKTYEKGTVVAVDSVNFQVKKGEIFGLIGPDGAGKTSIFRMLTTLILPDSGKATILDNDIIKDYASIRNQVGYMPGRFSLYQDLTVQENLQLYAAIFGTTIADNYYLIKDIYVQIEPFKNRPAGKLSGGMKQKLALCCALIHKPKVLFLDEPTTGIDPVSRKELWEMLRKLKSEDICILVSTPYMDEATMCDHIALIKDGNILSIDTPTNLVKSFRKTLYAISASNNYRLLKALEKYPKMKSSYAFGENIHAVFDGTDMELVTFLKQQDIEDVDIQEITPTVEDCFIALS